MESITQLSKTDSSKQRGTTMQSRAILLMAIMVLASLSPLAATELDASVDSDSTSGRTGTINHIQYFGTWTGQNALVNQTAITPITPMTIPLSSTPDYFSYTNDDFVIANHNSHNWWPMNTPSLSDYGTAGNAGTLVLNGNAQMAPQGKNFGGVGLGGNPGDNITSNNCRTHSTTEGGAFAGWYKPSSLDGQLFSRVRTQADGTFDAFNVSLTSDGYLQTKIYVDASNDTDFVWNNYDASPEVSSHDMNRIWNTTEGMDVQIEVDEWNYIAVFYYDSGNNIDVQVYVNNGTQSDSSHKRQHYMRHTNKGSHTNGLYWGYEPCVFGEGFEGSIDELRIGWMNTHSWNQWITADRAMGPWQTDGPTTLPTGLSFDYQTGVISGTPLVPWDPTDYEITVYSDDSNATTTLTLEVVEPELPSITHGSNNNFYLTTGDEESISPPVNMGGSDAFWTLTAGHPNYTGQVDVDDDTVCALDDEGKLYCWGKNVEKILDSNEESTFVVVNPTLHPDAAAANLTFTKISAESTGICGVLTNGTLWCWGDDNGNGRLGHGYSTSLQAPAQVLFDPELSPYSSNSIIPTQHGGTDSSPGCYDINPASGYGFESFENASAVAWEEYLIDANNVSTGSDGNWSYTNTSEHTKLHTLHGNYVLGSASSNQAQYDTQAEHTIIQNEESYIEMNITTGAGLLSLCFLLSGYNGNSWTQDYLYIELDGNQILSKRSYNNGLYTNIWHTFNHWVTAGDHHLVIKYVKDSSTSCSSNCYFDRVFIDALKWPLPTPSVNWTEPTVTDFAWYTDTACAIADSDVYCWGENGHGQLGTGDTTDRLRPTKVSTPAGASFSAVDVGSSHTCALTDTGTVWCWGYNGDYQLGLQNNTDQSTPMQVDFGTNLAVSSIDVGPHNVCAIGTNTDTSTEQLWCWGANNYYQTKDSSGSADLSDVWATDGLVYESASTGPVPEHVETTETETCTLYSNSTVQCMGLRYITESGTQDTGGDRTWAIDGFGIITSLSAGGSSNYGMCFMVEGDKALFCWGENDNHQMARGDTSTHALAGPVYGLIDGRDNDVLAPGLTFNNSNGMISGTPTTENQDPVELNIYSCNGRGCDSASFNYSIWDRPEVGLISIESDYLDLSVSPAEIYKGRPVNLSIVVTSDRSIANYTWYSEHVNGLIYSDMFPNSPSIVTDQLPVGLQVIFFSATDDIGGTSVPSDGWVIVEVLESDDDNDQVPVWNDLCPLENALGYDDYTGNGSSTPVSDGCIDNRDDDPYYDPDDSCPNEYAAPEYDFYIGEGTSGNAAPDGCIDDTDRDTILENVDQCLNTPFAERFYVNPDGCGPSERDTDGDGYKDNVDSCPGTPMGESVDEFGCGASQVDSDGDGVYDSADVCPESPLGATVDIDGCAAAEKDSDGDEVNDEVDVCDTTPPELWNQTNAVGCAPGDVVTDDNDQDGIADIFDSCPMTPLGDVVDYSGCGLTQKDSDNDGVTDDVDQCPDTPGYDTPTVDADGCGETQRDSDGDGVIDSVDQCLNTPTSVEVDTLGCHAGLSDSDQDSIVDIIDACPNTTGDQPVNLNGCAPYQLDSDGDGITNDLDSCPTTPAGVPITTNGCAEDPDVFDPVAEDDDGDGILNENDECPDTPLNAKVIDNRGCEVGTEGNTQQVSTWAFGLTGLILLLIALITVVVLRRRKEQESIWGSDAVGDALFDSMDLDGDGVISDEEWEIYKKVRDAKKDSDIDDDDLFD